GSVIVSDGLQCFSAVSDAGCEHQRIVTGGGPDSVEHKEFLWVNTMLGNVKNALYGTCHAIDTKHLPPLTAMESEAKAVSPR
ncbi:MAG: transposase, partial [gamma proteobacterium symbiont of Phacoides pectinatus]